jgi:hypothetical protein
MEGLSMNVTPSSVVGIGTNVYVNGVLVNAYDWLSRFFVPETVSAMQIIIGTSPSKKRRITSV